MANYLLFIKKNNKFILTCFLFFFITLPILAQPAGRILFNSDFEIPVLTPASPSPPRQSCSPATSCWYLTPESTVPGWNVVDAMTVSTDIINDNVELWNSGFLGVPSQSGNQFIELNADKETPVFFEICMFAGETLTWSLWHRGRNGTDQMILDVTDALGDSLLSQSISTDNTAWVNYTGMITNTGPNGAVRFTFRPGVTAGGNPTVGNFVDNIQILGLKPLVEFEQTTYSAIENAVSPPRLLVNGTIPVGGATVTIGVISGTATDSGTDYSFVTNVTIPAGNYDGTVATSIPINLTIVDDLLVESSETINFSIIGATDPLLVNDANCGGNTQYGTLYTIIDNDLILPVELVSFSAKTSENVELSWQTSSEKLSSHFELQRSKDGNNWQSIGKIPTTNTNSVQNYSFVDKNPLAKGYYQLKMVDIDNTYKFSKVIAVNFAAYNNTEDAILYPNPIQKGEKLEIILPNVPNDIQIQIDDILGRNHANHLLKTTNKTIAITAPATVGTYFITIFYNETVIRRKIVVQ